MSDKNLLQKWFLHTALSYLGTPYIWGGDDPSGFDCSGYVIECLKTIGLLQEKDDFTADGLKNHLLKLSDRTITNFELNIRVTEQPVDGALLFFLKKDKKARHVTICLDQYFHIGASGGNSTTKDVYTSQLVNAFIKIRPIPENISKYIIISLFD